MAETFVLLFFGLFIGAGDARKRRGRLVSLEESDSAWFEVDFFGDSHDTMFFGE